MKKAILFILCSYLGISASAQVFVDADASGANDGSSWDNAYTSLQDALDASETDVWIKTGVYKPEALNGYIYYEVNSPKNIYGGFAGTESSIDERDISSNPTNINGDINDDDSIVDFMLNREDNANHLFHVTLAAGQVIFDGLQMTNGTTDLENNDQEDFLLRGGAIFSESPIQVSNCEFRYNTAFSGGGIYVNFTSGSSVQNCVFDSNMSIAQGAGLMFNESTSPVCRSNQFISNQVVRGALYTLYCTDAIVEDCRFEFNSIVLDGWGGAGYFNWNSTNTMITNCEFSDNTGGNASGIYLDGRELEGALQATLDNCTFDSNSNTNYGGVLYAWTTNYIIRNSQFSGNFGPNATCFYSGRTTFLMEDCSFITNNADFGPCGASYSIGTNGTFRNCDFLFNEAFTSGGACMVGFTGQAHYENCLFENNVARFGGAIYMQNDTTKASFTDCVFKSNTSENAGGAITVNGSIELDVVSSSFESNMADVGGAISFNLDTMTTEGYLNIDKCEFKFNNALTQGGAVNISNGTTSISSSLFALNLASNIGTGGAISNNAFEGHNSVLDISNNTFAHNEGALAAGIAQFEDETGKARVNLVNNIIYNPGGNDYAVEDGDPGLFSMGGNLILQTDFDDVFIEENDESGTDPLFESLVLRDFQLQTGSPAINTGVLVGSHETDIDGNGIIEGPDKGCYDRGISSTKNTLDPNAFSIIGNPSDDQTIVRLEALVVGKFRMHVLDNNGKRVQTFNEIKDSNTRDIILDVSNYPAGQYYIYLINQQASLAKMLIVQH